MTPKVFIKNDEIFSQWKSCRNLLGWNDIERLMAEYSKHEQKLKQ